jgi:hypothetical protein
MIISPTIHLQDAPGSFKAFCGGGWRESPEVRLSGELDLVTCAVCKRLAALREERKRLGVLTTSQALQVYKVLVEECGAPDSVDSVNLFVQVSGRQENSPLEYRFQGALGFGGKLYTPEMRVSCYREDETPERLAMIDRANARLAALPKDRNFR